MKILSAATFAVACIMVVSLCSCEKPPTDYLALDKGYYHKELHRIVKRVDSGKWGDDLESVTSNLKLLSESTLDALLKGTNEISEDVKIDTSGYSQNRIYKLYTVASDLMTFTEPAKEIIDNCNNNQARVFVELMIVTGSFGNSIENPKGSLMAEFMKKYGQQHSKECLALLGERYEDAVKHLSQAVEGKMDALVSMGQKHEDSQLVVEAENLDLAGGKFDAMRMYDALVSTKHIEELRASKLKLKSLESGRLLADFIFKTCGDLRSAGIPFDMYNLAKVLAPEAVSSTNLPIRFKKLNEYSRICIPFDNYKQEKHSMSNVVSNMVHQKVRKTLGMN